VIVCQQRARESFELFLFYLHGCGNAVDKLRKAQ
jgi:hypothetical protein